MLKHSRVTGIPDVTRVGQATARPGNDPRTWFSYATVDAVGRDREGVFVDVTLLPSTERLTARVSSTYAGPDFGFYAPIAVDDEVVVAVPNGDPLHGGVVVGRMQSASDPLPQEALDHPDDVVLVVKKGTSLRIVVEDGGNVLLGSVDASRGVARISDSISVDLPSLQACLDLRYMQNPGPGIPLTLPVDGSITSASDTVKSE